MSHSGETLDKKIRQKPFYVTSRSNVYKINDTVVEGVLQIQSYHEEADTQMLLHTKHTSLTYPKVLLAANLYFLTGVKNSRRIIHISKVADYIFDTLKLCNVSKQVLIETLIGFHSFTGFDTISTSAGREKVKPC